MKLTGRAWILDEDDINTDVIYPGKYTYELFSPEEMAKHALEDFDPEFAGAVQKGDIVFAGRNFGCGSSREQAVSCMKHAGVAAIIAPSFARPYYRNSINQALHVIVCPEVHGSPRGLGVDSIRHFIDCVCAGRLPLCGFEDGRKVTAVLLAMEESADRGAAVTVDALE